MVNQVVPGYSTHEKCHSSLYESDHRNDDFTDLSIGMNYSGAQYNRATPYGM